MNKTLIFDISHLINKETGATEVYSFDESVKFDDIKLAGNLSGRVEIMRLEDGVNVVAKNIKTSKQFRCEKCLESFTADMKIDSAERVFFFNRPEIVDDPADLFLIDKKHLTVDLAEMFRQEIILHFPVIQVCSTRCKGICPGCGKNRNKKECGCKIQEEIPAAVNPFAVLKKLLKNNHGKTPGT